MIEFVCIYCMRDFITNSCFRHIQPLKLILSDCILAHADELNSSNSRILACVFSKALSLAKVIFKIWAVRLKDINYIPNTLISSYDNEVRISRLDFSIDFIRNAECP